MYKSLKKSCLILLSALAAAMLILACSFMLSPKTTARADTEKVAQVSFDNGGMSTWLSIEKAWSDANFYSPATVTLLADVEITDALNVEEGKDITLDLNGHMLKYHNDAETGSVIKVREGSFTLIDSDKTTAHTVTDPVTNEEVTISGGLITGGSSNFGAGVYVNGGTFTMNGGTISGNTNGGGVYVTSFFKYNEETDDFDKAVVGTFTMNGGTISGNTESGVKVVDGTFTMNGGTISGNAATGFGGGVSVKGTFEMTDGIISGNSAKEGGGVCVTDGTFTMNGGTISGNTAKEGGGVHVYNNCTFTMTDGTVSENTATDGGGVYVNENGKFLMSGGTISENAVNGSGGGVCVLGGSFEMKDGTVSGNKANDYGGGVHVACGGEFTMSGGLINSNDAFGCGGIAIDDNSMFTMTGGEVENNAANICGGVSIFGTFNVSGCPKITGNTGEVLIDGEIKTVAFNFDLQDNAKINVIGTLEEGAHIGVYNVGEIATGFTQGDKASKYFIPDNPDNCAYVSDETSGTVTVSEQHDIITHGAQAATCTEAGWEAYEGCSRCDNATDKVEIPATGHNLTHHEATAATEEKEGNSEYWSCDKCDKYFSDTAGETEITDKSSVTLPKLTPVQTETPSAPAEEKQSYWWLFLLLIPLAIGVGGITLGIYDYKKYKENKYGKVTRR